MTCMESSREKTLRETTILQCYYKWKQKFEKCLKILKKDTWKWKWFVRMWGISSPTASSVSIHLILQPKKHCIKNIHVLGGQFVDIHGQVIRTFRIWVRIPVIPNHFISMFSSAAWWCVDYLWFMKTPCEHLKRIGESPWSMAFQFWLKSESLGLSGTQPQCE
jgi:hypothetical protein